MFKAMKKMDVDLYQLVVLPISELGDFLLQIRRKKRPNKKLNNKAILKAINRPNNAALPSNNHIMIPKNARST